MEDELEKFLKYRGVAEHFINIMNTEKVDMTAISAMEEEDLQKFIPKCGDRYAVRDFCKKTLGQVNKRESLIDKLKRKINNRNKKCKKQKPNSDTDEEEGSSVFENNDSSSLTPHRKDNKTTRIIELGWSCDGAQVRKNNGGGTRRLSMPKSSKQEDILQTAIELFFPNGKSPKGKLSQFKYELLDFKGNRFDSNLTISEIYKITRLTSLRFYLSTTKKEKCETITSGALAAGENVGNPSDHLENSESQNLNDSNDLDTSNAINGNNYALEDFITFTEPSTSIADSNSDYLLALTLRNDEADFLLHDGSTELVTDVSFDENAGMVPITDNKDKQTLILHRGHIFEEMLEAFLTLDLNAELKIQLILPNGQLEAGYDLGGVFRDSLSEFWNTMYEKCTIGTSVRVPYIRHDFGHDKWSAIAKILWKGWKVERYFPIKLSTVFMENCLYHKTLSNIQEEFFKYISDNEKEILEKCLLDINAVDKEELLDVLTNFECKWNPTSENISELIRDIAHQELIQKPAYVIERFHDIIKNMLTEEELVEIYTKCKPTSKNILSIISFEDVSSAEREKVSGYLKKYIRECEGSLRMCFLRFCTGADVLTGRNITVKFSDLSGLRRMPVAHTCASVLELPENYEHFPEFRSEMNSLLNSNVWVMDII